MSQSLFLNIVSLLIQSPSFFSYPCWHFISIRVETSSSIFLNQLLMDLGGLLTAAAPIKNSSACQSLIFPYRSLFILFLSVLQASVNFKNIFKSQFTVLKSDSFPLLLLFLLYSRTQGYSLMKVFLLYHLLTSSVKWRRMLTVCNQYTGTVLKFLEDTLFFLSPIMTFLNKYFFNNCF